MDNTSSSFDPNPAFELLINGLIDQTFGFADHFISPELSQSLAQNLESYFDAGLMHRAGIGKNILYKEDSEFRGDVIKWIDNEPENESEMDFVKIIRSFIEYLNITCFTGIQDFEFHYARYAVGSRYRKHVDQFVTDQGRQFSLVIYLNQNWEESYGGALSLYLNNVEYKLVPYGGRAVFFRSNVTEHEVNVATEVRYSIAGWLKK